MFFFDPYLIFERYSKNYYKFLEKITSSSCKLVAVSQFLSSRIFVTLGKRIDIPDAVWLSDRVNSAPKIKFYVKSFNGCVKRKTGKKSTSIILQLKVPVISHTGDSLGSTTM